MLSPTVNWIYKIFGTALIAGLIYTAGNTIFDNPSKNQITPEDYIELLEGLNERKQAAFAEGYMYDLPSPFLNTAIDWQPTTNIYLTYTNNTPITNYYLYDVGRSSDTNSSIYSNTHIYTTNHWRWMNAPFSGVTVSSLSQYMTFDVGRFIWSGSYSNLYFNGFTNLYGYGTLNGNYYLYTNTIGTNGIPYKIYVNSSDPKKVLIDFYNSGIQSSQYAVREPWVSFNYDTTVALSNAVPPYEDYFGTNNQENIVYKKVFHTFASGIKIGDATDDWYVDNVKISTTNSTVTTSNLISILSGTAKTTLLTFDTVGKIVYQNFMIQLDNNIKSIIPLFLDNETPIATNGTYNYQTVTNVFKKLHIGDETNKFTKSPSNYTYTVTNQLVGTNIAYITNYVATTYGDVPMQVYKQDLFERYKVLAYLTNTPCTLTSTGTARYGYAHVYIFENPTSEYFDTVVNPMAIADYEASSIVPATGISQNRTWNVVSAGVGNDLYSYANHIHTKFVNQSLATNSLRSTVAYVKFYGADQFDAYGDVIGNTNNFVFFDQSGYTNIYRNVLTNVVGGDDTTFPTPSPWVIWGVQSRGWYSDSKGYNTWKFHYCTNSL